MMERRSKRTFTNEFKHQMVKGITEEKHGLKLSKNMINIIFI
ncbi:hypothetical protein [Pectinatus brassicae]|uniref:Transposase-like protein n=1 Tax=Pectinatus brassicae TaxID=862415 RepID=A0A840UE00_9FIRM|nr:hypothetical protein [Pectinatus brassicae]MBB5335336.1 transposase-like protein [Pectinatus brassicae]